MKHIFTLIAAVLLCACSVTAQDAPTRLPKVTVTDVNGNAVSADTITNGDKPMLMSFFATWCGPCRRELSEVSPKLAEWNKETGVKLVVVSLDDPAQTANVIEFAKGLGLDTANLYFDTTKALAKAMGVSGIPHMLYLDGKGNIVNTSVGYAPGHDEEIIERVREIIK